MCLHLFLIFAFVFLAGQNTFLNINLLSYTVSLQTALDLSLLSSGF